MKKHFIAFMMPFLTLATGFAQEAAQDVPVKQDTKEISYWTDPANGDKRLLNKSKFRDNWFVGLQGRRLLFLGDPYFQFWILRPVPSRRCVVHRQVDRSCRRYPPPRFLWKQCRTSKQRQALLLGRHGGRPRRIVQLHQPLLRV